MTIYSTLALLLEDATNQRDRDSIGQTVVKMSFSAVLGSGFGA
ncbi:MAG: hypothetical protein RBJ76_15720 [Stenomitos frigidus ULC029]